MIMYAVELLAACGLCFIFKALSDSFYWGWFGGACCMGLLHYIDRVAM